MRCLDDGEALDNESDLLNKNDGFFKKVEFTSKPMLDVMVGQSAVLSE